MDRAGWKTKADAFALGGRPRCCGEKLARSRGAPAKVRRKHGYAHFVYLAAAVARARPTSARRDGRLAGADRSDGGASAGREPVPVEELGVMRCEAVRGLV